MNQQLAVIFDMDGVILDSEGVMKQAWHNIGQTFGLNGIDELIARCTGVNEKTFAAMFKEKYGEEFPMEAYMQRMREEVLRLCDGVIPSKPGAAETLSALREAGVPLALASSTGEAAVRRELGAVGLYDCFDVVVCGNMVAASKPAPDIFLYAADRLSVDPANCIVVEDSHNGIRAAHAAGMLAVMVPDSQDVTDEMRRLAGAILPTIESVVPLVKKRLRSSWQEA